jgi:hypothetical protein
MKKTGNTLRVVAMMLAMIASFNVQAELIASVDRDRVAMGDTIRLTITGTANEPINNVDPRPLLRDFEILQRSSSSSTNIVNGAMTSSRQVILDLTPKRDGSLRIPALQVGRDRTNYLLVAVAPATTAAGDPLVDFTAELDSGTVYVQGQVIVTLRIQQAINLDARSVSELQLDNAFVKQLEQKSFQRTIDGRPWLVHEIRYAVFPEQSGTLEIPVQTFSARESQPRRSVFDIGGAGRQVTRKTERLTLKVLPKPASFPASTWLPARQLKITESWSTPPEQLRVGESATRRITITGDGLQSAQLPPTLFPATPGLKYYPDQPVITDAESPDGLIGARVDSAALVPTSDGNWNIPAVRIPWWDTAANKVRYAVLPARNVIVAPALDTSAPLSLPTPTAAPGFDRTPITIASRDDNSLYWKIAAIISSLGWLITLIFLARRYKKPRVENTVVSENLSEGAAFKQLVAACATQNTLQARNGIIRWSVALFPDQNIHSLDQVKQALNDAELTQELSQIEGKLYGQANTGWRGEGLIEVVKRLRKTTSISRSSQTDTLQLYPREA